MEQNAASRYPQEYVGHTLLEVGNGSDYRRIFARKRLSHIEVAEFVRGEVSRLAYGQDAHVHAVYLEGSDLDKMARTLPEQSCQPSEQKYYHMLSEFFGCEDRFLVDLMDVLDAAEVPYGYLNTIDSHVSFRPAWSRFAQLCA